MICKLKRFPMQLGIGLDRLFFCKATSPKLARRQIFVGMLCSIWFPSRYNLCRLFIPLIVDGMVPLKLLSLSASTLKFLKAPIPFGIGPFMLHDSVRNRGRELERFPTESCRRLEKGFLLITKEQKIGYIGQYITKISDLGQY